MLQNMPLPPCTIAVLCSLTHPCRFILSVFSSVCVSVWASQTCSFCSEGNEQVNSLWRDPLLCPQNDWINGMCIFALWVSPVSFEYHFFLMSNMAIVRYFMQALTKRCLWSCLYVRKLACRTVVLKMHTDGLGMVSKWALKVAQAFWPKAELLVCKSWYALKFVYLKIVLESCGILWILMIAWKIRKADEVKSNYTSCLVGWH